MPAKPSHIGMGVMNIGGDGLLSMEEEDINTEKTFLDMRNAEEEGCFGGDAGVWKD